MSIQTVQSKISQIQREIERLQKKFTDESSKEARKSDQIRKAVDRLTKTKSASTAKSKQREIQRLEKDIVRIQKKKADLTKKISSKTSDLHKAQNGLYKEQKKFQQELERKERESKRQISSLINQLGEPSSISNHIFTESTTYHHAFISHASEDKEEIVRPLAEKLREAGFDIWYDEFELKVGDSLRRKIDTGLANSKFGIVILSPAFFAKNWPQYELDGLVQKEMEGHKVILPLWHKVSKNEVMKYSPTLADKVALNTTNYTIEEIVNKLAEVLD